MKRDELVILIVIVNAIMISFLGSVVANLYRPDTPTEKWVVIISFLLFVVINIIATLYIQGKKLSFNRLVASLQQYSSLWLLVLLVSLFNLVGDKLQWVGISTRVTLLLFCGISVVGYINDLHSSRKYGTTTKIPHSNGNPFPYKNLKDKKE